MSGISFTPFKGPDRGIGTKSGLVLAYTQNGANYTITTATSTIMQLGLVTTVVSNGLCGIELQGTATAPLDLIVEVMHNGTSVQTFTNHVEGSFVLGIPFVLRNIPAEAGNWALRLHTSTSTVSLPVNASSWWIESGAIDAGLIANDPSSAVNEVVDLDLVTVTDTASEDTQTPTGASVSDSVSQTPLTITDSVVSLTLTTIVLGTASDDGFFSSAGFNAGGTVNFTGNSGGVTRTAFYRFALPYNLAGQNVTLAYLDVTPDANQSTPVQIRVEAEASGTAVAITSAADFASRTLTTAHLDTSFAATTGSVLSIDVTNMITEIQALGGAVTAIQVFLVDNGSPTDAQLSLRAAEYSGSGKPQLRFYIGGV